MLGDSVYISLQSYGVDIRIDADAMLFITIDIDQRKSLGSMSGMCGNMNNDQTGNVFDVILLCFRHNTFFSMFFVFAFIIHASFLYFTHFC